MKYGKVYATSPEIEGVAVWVPDKHADMTMWGMMRSGGLSYGMKMGKETIRNLSIISKQLSSDRKRLMKNKPYIYLTIIGVISAMQGKGLGGVLMDALKEECSSKEVHLYLETEAEENLAFYQKHGLTVIQKIMFKKINLPMWQMVVKP